MSDSSANILISSFLNFPITIKECKNCYFIIDFFFFKVTFHFLVLPFWLFPYTVMFFSLTYLCSWTSAFLKLQALESLWCSLFPWWFSLLLRHKCYSMMELWYLLNSFFFPSSYLWQDPGHQFIYPTPFL